MSIRNFPKIPKIILRKSADEPKDAKTDLRHFFSQIWTRNPIYGWLNIILWYIYIFASQCQVDSPSWLVEVSFRLKHISTKILNIEEVTCRKLISYESGFWYNSLMGGTGFKLHIALTDHPTDILATKPAGKCGYGMGSKFLSRFRPSNTSRSQF